MSSKRDQKNWRKKLRTVIYGTSTPAGKIFDIILLGVILLSVVFVMLESVENLSPAFHRFLYNAEWVITGLFTLEYIARIACVKKPKSYIFSFYGIIDLISTLPLYVTLFISGGAAFLTIRAFRLLRIFRILKINRYIGEGNRLKVALKNSRAKIFVFLFTVFIICIIAGTLMYLIEGSRNEAFTSIPRSVYWCIVTLTTVGFGDIYPVTALGQAIASLIMIMGYGIIAVPTGIVTAEFSRVNQMQQVLESQDSSNNICSRCGHKTLDVEATYCSNCGKKLV